MLHLTAPAQESRAADANFAHLSEELRRLDLAIHLRIHELRVRRPVASAGEFKGLVLWEEEIDELLRESMEDAPPAGESEFILRRLRDQLAEMDARIAALRAAERQPSRLARLAGIFALDAFEERCLMICLAPEIDRKYEKLYAYLHDDVTRKRPSVGLALDLAGFTGTARLAARRAFDASAPLVKHRLIEILDDPHDPPATLLARSMKLDDRIVDFLFEVPATDGRLAGMARLFDEPAGATEASPEIARLSDFAAAHANDGAILHLRGGYGSGRRAAARAIAERAGKALLLADAARMIDAAAGFEEVARRAAREAMLAGAMIAVENFDALLADERRRAQIEMLLEIMTGASKLVFLLGEKEWALPDRRRWPAFVAIEFPAPDESARRRLWRAELEARGVRAGESAIEAIASRFRFTPGRIEDAARAARDLAAWRAPGAATLSDDDLRDACRAQITCNLEALAHKIEPRFTWDDLVLPEDQMAQLREICEQVRLRHVVFGRWGFDRRAGAGGINALFSGPPGTGKTMAAEVIASELGIDLYRIDLSQVVSKYIGETEKNLSRVFQEARSSGTILFFDEADALFGKRSEVKDAHDRYANIEIGYLLQEMERYDGIAILATNMRQSMDEAFVRRLRTIIEFPFPDFEHRRRIWEVIFPEAARLAEDVNLAALAREVRLAGGYIKNIALAAAFYAAAEGEAIRMEHLIEATRREYQKLGWPWNDAPWRAETSYATEDGTSN